MRTPLLLLAATLFLPVSAAKPEKVTFDVDDRFSIEFPENWVEKESPRQGALVHREHKERDATFTVSRLVIPPGRSADLDATLETFVGNYRKAGFTIKERVKGQGGLIDGKKSLFANVPATIVVDKKAIDLNFFVVFIEAKERLLILEATLPANAPNDLRADCRKIIGSFHEKGPDDAKAGEKKEDKTEDKGPKTE